MSMENRLGLGFVRQPKTVLFGPGQRRQLGLIAKGLGRHALMVTDERMAQTPEFKGLLANLAEQDVKTSVYDRALPDLPRSNIVEAVSLFGGKGADVVVGVGGGSCLDLAKSVAVVLANGGDVRDFYGEFRVPRPSLPIITVPTTGGTGAEVTSIAVIFDDETNMKMAITDAHIEPTAAIIDPELTLTCPRGLTAATAADALSHLVEGFTARPKNPTPQELATKIYVGKNRITDIFCVKGLELMNKSLGKVVENPSNLDARSDVMFAAYCAGMVINTTGTAAAHAIQSPIAAFSHTSARLRSWRAPALCHALQSSVLHGRVRRDRPCARRGGRRGIGNRASACGYRPYRSLAGDSRRAARAQSDRRHPRPLRPGRRAIA